jgi:putative hemolysin
LVTAVGLVLLALALYTSTLSHALRDYSRSELSEPLPGEGRRWLEWLEQHESELRALTGFLRMAAVVGVVVCVCAWYRPAGALTAEPATLLIPALISIGLLLVCSVAIPHGLAMHASAGILAYGVWPLLVLRTVFWPIGQGLVGFEFVIRRLLGKADQSEDDESELMEQEILAAVSEGEATGAVDEEQKEIIESVFRLDDTTVSAIMTPRTEVTAIHAEATYDEVRDLIVRTGHSRVPVYEGSVDHIIGVLYAKDLLRLRPGEPFSARQLMRIAPYVPETKSVNDLLGDFRQSKVQIAIVLDEYGGTAGMVTIEDILEELVGEIDDEYDQRSAPIIHRIDENTVEVDARVRVDQLNAELGITLPEEEDYDTVGGFVFSTLGKIPAVGEEFQHDEAHFVVLAAEPRKIRRLRIRVDRAQAQPT